MSLNERVNKLLSKTAKPLLLGIGMTLLIGGYNWAISCDPKDSPMKKTGRILTYLTSVYGPLTLAERYYSRKISAEQALKTAVRRSVQYG